MKRDRLITDVAIRLIEKWDKRYSPRNVLAGDPDAPLIPERESTDEELLLKLVKVLKDAKDRRDATRAWLGREAERVNYIRAARGMPPAELPVPDEVDIALESVADVLEAIPDNDTSCARARGLPSRTTEIGDLI